MESITHKGKEYKKIAILAKEFNYTSDYIGQLCREKKVDARLVGRAWYVHPESLREHKKGRYQDDFKSTPAPKNDTEAQEDHETSVRERVAVEAVRTNKTDKIIKHIKRSYNETPLKYEIDEGSLIPTVAKLQTDIVSSQVETQIIKEDEERAHTVPIQLSDVARKKEKEEEDTIISEAPSQVSIRRDAMSSKEEELYSEPIEITLDKSAEAPADVVPIHIQKTPEKLVKYSQNGHLQSVAKASMEVPVQPVSFHPKAVQQAGKTTGKTKKTASRRATAAFSVTILLFAFFFSAGLLFLGTQTTAGADSVTITFFFDGSLFERFYTYNVFPI